MAATDPDPGARAHAGASGCERFARTLELPAPDHLGPGWTWQQVEGIGSERLRLSLARGEQRLTFCLLAGAEGGAFLRTPHLRLVYEGRTIDSVAERYLRAVARAVGDRDLDTLLSQLVAEVGEREVPAGDDLALDPAALDGSGGPEASAAWWSGFTDRDWYFEPSDPIYVSSRHVLLEHGDRECWHSHPWPEPGKLNYYNHPWVALPHRHRSEPRPPMRELVSEIGETEVVMGSVEALSSLSSAAVAVADEVDVYLVNHLCTPVVIGDDLDALGHRIEEQSGRPVIHMTREDKRLGHTVEPLYARARRSPRFFQQPLESDTVNLVGFPAAYRREELLPLLAALGRRPNVQVVPDLDFDSLTRVLRAPLSLLCADLTPADAFADLCAGRDHRIVALEAPFGWQRSLALLRQVAQALAVDDAADAWLSEHRGALLARFDELREQARAYRLGLVLGAEQLQGLLGAGVGKVPLLQLIGELGFGVDLLLFGEQPLQPELGTELGDVKVLRFSTAAELRELLVTGEAAAIYSDTYFDWRLTTAGKAQFSLRHLELGMAGACRTLDNLLAVCRLPFYRRYGHMLPRRDWA